MDKKKFILTLVTVELLFLVLAILFGFGTFKLTNIISNNVFSQNEIRTIIVLIVGTFVTLYMIYSGIHFLLFMNRNFKNNSNENKIVGFLATSENLKLTENRKR